MDKTKSCFVLNVMGEKEYKQIDIQRNKGSKFPEIVYRIMLEGGNFKVVWKKKNKVNHNYSKK